MAKHGRITVLLAVLLAAMSMCAPAVANAQSDVAVGTTVSGMVRVYLSSIGGLNAVDLTCDGSYSIGGDLSRAIARGTRLSISNSGGTLRLGMNGQTLTMGSRFKLRRHRTSGENGVRIEQARYPSNLYPGDIELIANGGNVQIIVHVFIEDYMRGVLPYEMDNSFPTEALKAQAVAARTYALKKMSAQAATYDLVDTTSDQVYNGTPQGNPRVVEAVDRTAGIIGTVNGEYMAGYYTASNGGQTESVQNAWGSGSYAYLPVQDDPYDLRNTASIARSVVFYADGTTGVPALTQLLATEAAAQVGAGSVQIEAITSVTPHTPRYAPPSRVFTKVDVGLRLFGYGDVTVTLDYFSQIEGLCGLSINVLRNETIDVTPIAEGFKLTARRFGHGVGMSQRGAQQMANEGIPYDRILEFYYPGLVRTRYTMTHTILPSMDGTPDDTDEPIGDGQIAIVTLSNPLDSVNLRKEPSMTSAVLACMPHGTQVTLLEMDTAWSRVQYGTLSGYVSNAYISVVDDDAQEEIADGKTHGNATVSLQDESQTLNLRAAPTLGAAVIARLHHGQVLTVLERYGSWTYVQYGTLKGYVSNTYIIYDSAGNEADSVQPTPSAQPSGVRKATVRLQNEGSKLNVREAMSLGARVLARLSSGDTVTVTRYDEAWCAVQTESVSGYCATDYLHFEQEQTQGGIDAWDERYMAIVLPSGGLNLRAWASRTSGAIMTLPQGTMLVVTGAQIEDMLPVRLGTLHGYVASEYVYVMQSASSQGVTTQYPTLQVTPTPAPEAERYALVTASNLTLRSGPGIDYEALTVMPRGTLVMLTGEPENGFYPVLYGELDGYASARYLQQAAPSAVQTPSPGVTAVPAATPTALPASPALSQRAATVTASSGLNLRDTPSQSGNVIATLGYGVSVIVTGEQQNGFWPVRVGTLSGYASASFLRFADDLSASSAQSEVPIKAQTDLPDGSALQGEEQEVTGQESTYRALVQSENGLNLRAAPQKGSEVLYVLPYGMVVQVLGEAPDGYLQVQWGSYTGYVSAEYVQPLAGP